MNNPGQHDLRKNQKDRTRSAIVEGALSLMRDGITPTVTAAAEAAGVSRATAYRYFPTQESLRSETVAVTPGTQWIEVMLRNMSTSDPRERLRLLVDAFNNLVIENEAEYRAAMKVYLDSWFESRRAGEKSPNIRAGRRRRWLESALDTVMEAMEPEQWLRLRDSLVLTMGIESIVVLKDVCGLDDEAALDVLRATALTILEAQAGHLCSNGNEA